jgi:hypothetical protein
MVILDLPLESWINPHYELNKENSKNSNYRFIGESTKNNNTLTTSIPFKPKRKPLSRSTLTFFKRFYNSDSPRRSTRSKTPKYNNHPAKATLSSSLARNDISRRKILTIQLNRHNSPKSHPANKNLNKKILVNSRQNNPQL